jgi:hypothetical protein
MKKSPFEANLWLGVTLRAWLRLLVRNRFAIRPGRWPMAGLVAAAAAGNSLLRAAQSLSFGRRVRQMVVPADPIFIIGHWRTGTTMLHELLALDPRHRCPSTYESLAPNHFLLTEKFVRRFARFLLPRTRPFDNVRMSFDRPQEDEAALALRGAPSPFLTVAFPRRPPQDPEYVDLDGLTPEQLADWRHGMLAFLQLLLYRRPGRLVLKSPQHTNRLRVLNEMFPQARFVHVVRDPYTVFSSTVHFWSTMYDRYGLQRPDAAAVREKVFVDFEHMHNRLEETHSLIPASRFHEVRYERLVADPLAEMRSLYADLDLGDFDAAAPAISRYAERSKRYSTNRYELDAATRREITRRWAGYLNANVYRTRYTVDGSI